MNTEKDLISFRKFTATGKYLHENDIRWCIKNTKFTSEKEIIKWFKRFRTLCPKGDMNIAQVELNKSFKMLMMLLIWVTKELS
jgi:hypothetical protein